MQDSPNKAEASAKATTPRRPQGRRAVITREDLIQAALALIGPHRSVSTLSLREITREAGIAPNSFYRHFKDTDELAVALIDMAGEALRKVVGEAQERAASSESVVRSCVEVFMKQLNPDEKFLPILLREGTVGSDEFKAAVERQLMFFEEELCEGMQELAQRNERPIAEAALTAKAITRLIFAMGATAMDQPKEKHPEIIEQMVTMVRIIMVGTQTMAISDPDTD